MNNWYHIYANIDGKSRWHMVYDKRPGLYFVELDFEKNKYDIERYRLDFPRNEVVPVLNVHQTKHPLGVCDDHMKAWNRVECPLCDALFLYDRLRLATMVIEDSLELLSKIPDNGNEDANAEEDESLRGQVCINLERFLNYARKGNDGPCTCDEVGEGRCSKHGWEQFMEDLRKAKEKR